MGYLDGQIEALGAALAEWGIDAVYTPKSTGTTVSLLVEKHPVTLDPGQSLDDRVILKNDGEWRIKCKQVRGVSFSGPAHTAEVCVLKFAVSEIAAVHPGDVFTIDSDIWQVI